MYTATEGEIERLENGYVMVFSSVSRASSSFYNNNSFSHVADDHVQRVRQMEASHSNLLDPQRNEQNFLCVYA